MSMSKKDFVALADTIRSNREVFPEQAIHALAVFCGRQNGNFNGPRWLAYIDGQCGPNGGAVKKS